MKVTGCQVTDDALLKRIWGLWSLPVSIFAFQIEQINRFPHRKLLCCVLPPQTQSNRTMGGEVQTSKQNYHPLLLKYAFVWHVLCACRDRRLASDVFFNHCRPLFSRQGLSLYLQLIDLVRLTGQRTPNIHLSPISSPPCPITGVTDSFLVLWTCTQVQAYAFVAGPLQTEQSPSPKILFLSEYF